MSRFELGEGLVWDALAGRLMMTDILRGSLVAVDLDSGDTRSWPMPEPIGWVLPSAALHRYIVGLRSGIALVDTAATAAPRWLNRQFPGIAGSRLNDACTDSAGRIWLGSLDSGAGINGRLASFTPQHGIRIHDTGFGVTNGPVISPDERHLYISDTMRRVVYRYPFSRHDGTLGKRKAFLRFDDADGYPDGMCFDQAGNLWIAMWAGSRVIQVDRHGRVRQTRAVPAPNVTNVCFCGPSYDRLLVSTATLEMSLVDRAAHPDAGGLFEILDHGSRGLPTTPAHIE